VPDESEPPSGPSRGGHPPNEPPTAPIEPPTGKIRAALIEAVCDGDYRPFSEEAIAGQREATDRLQRLVHAYVSHLRDRGTPPERAVGFMKALVRDTKIPCGRPLLALENQIMRWCIDAYYSGREEAG
jgi:hypothetical protein